jgi:hypothetical protein
MRVSSTVFLLAILSLCGSCAAILHGSRQRVDVYSDPPGARVIINGTDQGIQTPASVSIKRKTTNHTFKFVREGYEPYTYHLVRRFNYLVLVDFMMYVVPGIIDVAVGAHNIYDDQVLVNLVPNEAPLPVQIPIVSVAAGYSFNRLSDVDVDVPLTGQINHNRYALIIGNEDYGRHQRDMSSEVNVMFARNDASAFQLYARYTLGIPERNITMLLDATAAEMRQGLLKMNLIAKNSNGEAEFYVYYAGHGLPDETTKNPYLMPVDVSGKYVQLGIPLSEFYQTLSEHPSKRVTVFLDACFSGGARGQGLYAARGVRITPKNENLKGNFVVFTASSGEESALPYDKQHHGLFTYYLLQKLKDTGGSMSYKELSDFLSGHVALESVIVNNKEQHPKTNISPDVLEAWESWTLR